MPAQQPRRFSSTGVARSEVRFSSGMGSPEWFQWLAVVVVLLSACDRSEKDWELAVSKDTVAAYETFVEEHPDSRHRATAELELEERRFREAESEDTIPAWERFLAHHPEGALAQTARDRVAREEAALATASSLGTAAAYADFLEAYPRSHLAADVRGRIRGLERHPGFRDASAVTIEVSAWARVAAAVEGAARSWFELVPLDVVQGEQSSVPMVRLSVVANCRGLAARYEFPGERSWYTGASVSGSLLLEQGGKRLTARFEGRVEPPGYVRMPGPDSPEDAPCEEALVVPGSLADELARTMARAFGASVVLDALNPTRPWQSRPGRDIVRHGAIRISPLASRRAVGPLLALLERGEYRASVIAALGATRAPEAVVPLLETLDEPGSEGVIAAIEQITGRRWIGSGESHDLLIETWREWFNGSQQSARAYGDLILTVESVRSATSWKGREAPAAGWVFAIVAVKARSGPGDRERTLCSELRDTEGRRHLRLAGQEVVDMGLQFSSDPLLGPTRSDLLEWVRQGDVPADTTFECAFLVPEGRRPESLRIGTVELPLALLPGIK